MQHSENNTMKARVSRRAGTVATHLSLAALVLGTLAFAGCGGGGATFKSTGDKTLGQELQDLDASYQKGIITEKQYNEIKLRLIKMYTH